MMKKENKIIRIASDYEIRNFGFFEYIMSSETNTGRVVDFLISKNLKDKIYEINNAMYEQNRKAFVRVIKDILKNEKNQEILLSEMMLFSEIDIFSNNKINIMMVMEKNQPYDKKSTIYILSKTELN
jgi:hypothetical protein